MNEIWKPIPGYEGLYDASSQGRIRSSPGKTTGNARFPVRVWKSRIIKEKHPVGVKRQDLRVSLWKEGKHTDHLVARLIASAWIGCPENGMTVNHINGDWKDNRPENLEWVSLAQNIKAGFKNGQYDSICNKIVLLDNDGNKHKFNSMAEASRFLGKNNGYVSGMLKRGNGVLKDNDGNTFTVAEEERR